MAIIKPFFYFKINVRSRLLSFCLLAALTLAGLCQNIDTDSFNGVSIILDAGHGGIDSGAEYNGVQEKNVNLELSLKVAELLRSRGAAVSLTREGDIDYYTRGKGGKRNDLLKRIELIDAANAELFISIHCNASSDKRWHGAQVYYNPNDDANRQLAEYIQQSLRDFDKDNKRSKKADTKILLLKNTATPGVLVEAGFLSNEHDAFRLKNPDTQAEIAACIVKGIELYIKEVKKMSG